jgi:hypothetical protein
VLAAGAVVRSAVSSLGDVLELLHSARRRTQRCDVTMREDGQRGERTVRVR